jgi:hypothetical protein
MALLSVNLSDLMAEVIQRGSVPSKFQAEDMSYISNALEQAKMAKQYDFAGNLEMSIFHLMKARKIIEQLYEVRKEDYPEYQILQASFYYKVGDSLSTYIECNMNEMN